MDAGDGSFDSLMDDKDAYDSPGTDDPESDTPEDRGAEILEDLAYRRALTGSSAISTAGRNKILGRDDHRCIVCRRSGSKTVHLQVAHIIARTADRDYQVGSSATMLNNFFLTSLSSSGCRRSVVFLRNGERMMQTIS